MEDEEEVEKMMPEVEEEKVVDFTVPSKVQEELDRTFNPRRLHVKEYLTPKEEQVFTKMIFNRFYLEEGQGPEDEAMWYQAGLEIRWLQEWAEETVKKEFKEKNLSTEGTSFEDTVRRTLKKAIIERHDLYKPLAYIIGSQPFFACDIVCEPPLLCPRPETELWTHWVVQNVIKRVHDSSRTICVLDVCCGTGCIGVAIAKNVSNVKVVAVDVLDAAVETSNRNARRNGIEESRYIAKKSDMFEIFFDPTSIEKGGDRDTKQRKPKIASEYRGTFDIIVSNPPYILPEQYVNLPYSITHWESKLALVGDDRREHKQYLYFQELCEYGAALLQTRLDRDDRLRMLPNMFIEIGLQAHAVASIMERSGLFSDVSVHQDYAKQERWISANSTH